MIRKFFKHLKLVIAHKYYVCVECFKVGLYWQGITHDLSKFSVVEFSESVRYFTGHGSPIDEAKKDKGYSDAWMHHKGRNKHHWQYWVDGRDGKIVPLEMPDKYIKEMICDVKGASRAYLKDKYTDDKPLQYLKDNIGYWVVTDRVRKRLFELI